MTTTAADPAVRRLTVLIFALAWLGCAWFGSWEFNPNTATRLFAAISLAEDGDATIDEYAAVTIDQARFGPHVYLDKAPGMTLLAVPVVALADRATGASARPLVKRVGDPALGDYLRLRLRLAVALIGAPLIALAAAVLFRLMLFETGDRRAGVVAALGFACASPVWGWGTTWFGHAPVAALYLLAAAAAHFATRTCSVPAAAGVGLALGAAVVIEYQAVLAGAVIAGWALWRLRSLARGDRLRLGAAALAGGLPPLAALLGYNLLAFGTPFRIGYSGVTGFAGMQQGVFGLGWPDPHVLLELLVGPRRGLIWVAPALAFAPLALARMIRLPETRALGVMAAAGAAVVLLVNAAYVYWDGGVATGPRHAVPAIGFLALALGFRWVQQPRDRPAIVALLGLSYVLNLAIAAADIFAPPDIGFPIWTRILAGQFAAGALRTFPSEWFGVGPWLGFALYLAVAIPLFAAIRVASRPPRNV